MRGVAGVDRLFLLTPGIGLDHTRHAVAAARSAGVRHIVHLSSFNVLGDFRTDTVERLLRRRPRTFAAWCARNADAFRVT
ncbi:hypothetical protein ACIBQ1_28165 [Nonomuraea sp. NPDC050153]|uniref:hypothetical protein n=1 Tax=Nonomuraea sp. NPDC050153 TaxID=3364359 RepID=UPI00379E3844